MSEPASKESITIDCADAITLITGILCVPISRVYELYRNLTGQSLYTHQLPRAFRTTAPLLKEQLPDLAAHLDATQERCNSETWQTFILETIGQFGNAFTITPIEITHRDPIEEAVEMVGPDRVIVVSEGSNG